MSELSPRARTLLEAARRNPLEPPEGATERMEHAVLMATAAAAVGVGVGVGSAKAASAGLLSKLVIGALVLSVVSATIVVTWSRSPAVSQPAAAAPVPAVRLEPAPVAEVRPEQVVATASPGVSRRVVPPVSRVMEAVSPAPAPSAFSAELALLQHAKAGVEAHDWAGALAALDRYDAEFPEGTLRLEASVLRVLSWCGVGRVVEANELASHWRAASPNAPALNRLAGSCVDP